jgi:hypothetical protein
MHKEKGTMVAVLQVVRMAQGRRSGQQRLGRLAVGAQGERAAFCWCAQGKSGVAAGGAAHGRDAGGGAWGARGTGSRGQGRRRAGSNAEGVRQVLNGRRD